MATHTMIIDRWKYEYQNHISSRLNYCEIDAKTSWSIF